jgi:LemA protein
MAALLGILLTLIILAVVVAVIVFAVGITMYNSLVKQRNHVREMWSGIDTELKRRYDLIPNLVKTVESYAKYEQETLRLVIEARNRAANSTGSPEVRAKEESVLGACLQRFLAVVERYPNLKANTTFLELQRELANTEDRIQATRRFYNANVRTYNTSIESFPSNMIAQKYHFERAQFFELEEAAARSAPVVNISTGPAAWSDQPRSAAPIVSHGAGSAPTGGTYCPACGTKTRPDGRFCQGCGAQLGSV